MRQGQDDPALTALHFQMGRYLLIGSSRPGQLPANLQGLWNEQLTPPWNSDYHININLQMNYWPAEVTNLSELHAPLFDYMDALVPSGRRTAKVHYGARGWVAHHLSDVWGFTTPADSVVGVWPMGAAWMVQHFWEHYLFTQDRDFLKARAYPIMKEAAQFMLDFLVPDGRGRLVTNPSHSPENAFVAKDGKPSKFTYGATMDLQIVHDLFSSTIAGGGAAGRGLGPAHAAGVGPAAAGPAADQPDQRPAAGVDRGLQGSGSRAPAHLAPVRVSTRGGRSPGRRPSWRRRPARAWSSGWPTRAGAPGGAGPGSPTCGRASATAIAPTTA